MGTKKNIKKRPKKVRDANVDENYNYIAAYGTLRKGDYNYEKMGCEYITTGTLNGWQLYDLNGNYPGAIAVENNESKIKIDILSANKEQLAYINEMEQGAGYTPQLINIGYRVCTIYHYDLLTDKEKLIKHGDWLKYKKEKLNKNTK